MHITHTHTHTHAYSHSRAHAPTFHRMHRRSRLLRASAGVRPLAPTSAPPPHARAWVPAPLASPPLTNLVIRDRPPLPPNAAASRPQIRYDASQWYAVPDCMCEWERVAISPHQSLAFRHARASLVSLLRRTDLECPRRFVEATRRTFIISCVACVCVCVCLRT